MKFKLSDKTEISFNPSDFVRNDKYLVKVMVNPKDFPESIWAWLSRKDMADYKKDVRDDSYTRVAIAANFALNGIPWGAFFPIKLQGSSIPVCEKSIIYKKHQKVIFAPGCEPIPS